MARYTGPKARISRRLGINVWGTSGETKALDRRPAPQANTVVVAVEAKTRNT